MPASTSGNWIREFGKWAPEIVAVYYGGSKANRDLIRTYELFMNPINTDRRNKVGDVILKCHVIITSYETFTNEPAVFANIDFQSIVIDEGHRLKSDTGKLFTTLKAEFPNAHKVLLTGTPIQNNMRELFTLLNIMVRKGLYSVVRS